MPSAQGRQKQYQLLWNGHYRWVWATVWVLGTKPGASKRATGAFNSWAISPRHARHTYMSTPKAKENWPKTETSQTPSQNEPFHSQADCVRVFIHSNGKLADRVTRETGVHQAKSLVLCVLMPFRSQLPAFAARNKEVVLQMRNSKEKSYYLGTTLLRAEEPPSSSDQLCPLVRGHSSQPCAYSSALIAHGHRSLR